METLLNTAYLRFEVPLANFYCYPWQIIVYTLKTEYYLSFWFCFLLNPYQTNAFMYLQHLESSTGTSNSIAEEAK